MKNYIGFVNDHSGPIPVTSMFQYFETREEARQYCNANGIRFLDMQKNITAPKQRRWSVPTARPQQQQLRA